MDYNKLAEILFPNIDKTPAYYEELYPHRNLAEGAMVTRLGPSPTGFIHLGNLYGAFADERLAHQSDGIFYLRIEDTDDKRYVEGAVETIIKSLDFFGIRFDEGASMEGDTGIYGPYKQSERADIYQCFAKELVLKGQAYPCFLTESEIGEIREFQEKNKLNPGIYGEFAKCRDLSLEEITSNIEKGMPYVMRLRSDGNPDNPKTITVEDGIRGELSMPENTQDIVILKTNGIPTYHFAHVVDDHLMRTTHVVRGAEWIPSLPIHIELFDKLGFELPVFCHTGQLMKIDEDGSKRKLSKRKDPELSLDYYRKEGYHPAAVREYLLTILNSNFEEWRIANPLAPAEDFHFTVAKMNGGGALFDLRKLEDVSKDVLIRLSSEELYSFLNQWACEFRPDLVERLSDKDYWIKVLDLDRTGAKPRKDLISAKQIIDYTGYFFEYIRQDDYPAEAVNDKDIILTKYLETYDHSDDQSVWFDKIRAITDELGYAVKPKDYKKHPEDYKGHVGHVSTVIRIALTGRANSPDIWEIQQIMGEEKALGRIRNCIG
ncbi:MAG: glutamate--tRNA ligase family protein [Anaerovoracaceae bacterium]|nr:glutamate--tRNA ligase family protein [Anaerovoracaceae bacterium]